MKASWSWMPRTGRPVQGAGRGRGWAGSGQARVCGSSHLHGSKCPARQSPGRAQQAAIEVRAPSSRCQLGRHPTDLGVIIVPPHPTPPPSPPIPLTPPP